MLGGYVKGLGWWHDERLRECKHETKVKKILFGASKGAIQQTMMIASSLPTMLVGSDDEFSSTCGSR
jgi:hypothetical protein